LRTAEAPPQLRDRPDAGAGTNLSFFVRTPISPPKTLHQTRKSWQSVAITLWENEGCRRPCRPGA